MQDCRQGLSLASYDPQHESALEARGHSGSLAGADGAHYVLKLYVIELASSQ